MARISSGSSPEASGVEPVISANMIVTTRLSSGAVSPGNGCVCPLSLFSAGAGAGSKTGAVVAATGAADALTASLLALVVSGVPHSMQNFALGRLIVPQCGQTSRRFPHSKQNFAPTGLIV